MTFKQIQTIRQASTSNSSGSPLPQRVSLPGSGETVVRIHIESGSATGLFVTFGDSSVTATSANGVLFKAVDLPELISFDSASTHLSFITATSTAILNLSFGTEV